MLLSLPKPLQEQWSNYRRLEGHPLRDEALAALNTFIGGLLRLPENEWHPWALSFAAEVVDRGGYVVRAPLFERVVFPALLDGADRHETHCARWLGGMAQHLYRCPSCMQSLGPDRSSELALFRRALADNAEDRIARCSLIKVMASQFSYSLHELPSGVLFGHDGATPAQCGQLRSELAEFEAMLEAEGCTEAHTALVEKCRFHFAAYEQYLATRPQWESYAAFVSELAR